MQATITLHIDAVLAPAHRAVTICSQLIPISLGAIAAADLDNPPKIDGVFVQLDNPPHQDMETSRAQFSQWLVAKGLQELARGVRGALEEAAVYLWGFEQNGVRVTVSQLREGLARVRRRANQQNFPDLLQSVSAGLTRPFDFAPEYRSLQRARSCLEHQDGVVLARHLDPGTDRMTLAMPTYELWAVDLSPPRQLEPGMKLERASRIELRPERTRLSFAEGEHISLNAADLQRMALGCLLFVQDLAGKLPNTPLGPKSLAGG